MTMVNSDLRLELVKLVYTYGIPIDEVVHRARTLESFITESDDSGKNTLRLKKGVTGGNVSPS